MTDATTPSPITLREITLDNLYNVLGLKVSDAQRQFVADNARSLAEAAYHPQAWPRAIYAGETPVGFAMLAVDENASDVYLWRYMIDAQHQGRGYGRAALADLIAYVRTLPFAKTFTLSYVPGDGCPEPFYRKLGFTPTGEIHDGELVMRMTL